MPQTIDWEHAYDDVIGSYIDAELVDEARQALADLLLGLPSLQRIEERSFIYEPELASEDEQVNNKIEQIRQEIAQVLGVKEASDVS